MIGIINYYLFIYFSFFFFGGGGGGKYVIYAHWLLSFQLFLLSSLLLASFLL